MTREDVRVVWRDANKDGSVRASQSEWITPLGTPHQASPF
jgi:hypothetical protein